MATPKAEPVFKLGDRVRILRSGGQHGRIVEYRGPLAPGGVHVCTVRVPLDPDPHYIELREDQLKQIPAKA